MRRRRKVDQDQGVVLPAWQITVTRTIDVPGCLPLESVLHEEIISAQTSQDASHIASRLMSEHTGDSFRLRRHMARVGQKKGQTGEVVVATTEGVDS
ncbi:hypothetical protein OJF2_64530 [Aquisphaera giovannonii]|uniref:Uncharacterized protein n=1 Tax=Aquisphaera giovannonii TaxID=406548 RepID=A0A5B9WD39_9BACT|nr:hypothetical protein [Aquisphaera giovannonii]QEH37861.1 hypothetical protein OJF2_64530 [Aquisphaera giovannonii]